MRSKPRPWIRDLWAILHAIPREAPILLGDAWELDIAERIKRAGDGEPAHVLLFETRKEAREWCKEETANAKLHSQGWTFRAVRVRETVRVIA